MSIQFTPEHYIPLKLYPKREGIQRYELTEDVEFNNGVISLVVPKGFLTDFASVPRFLWAIFPPIDRWSRAALIHDYLYRTGKVSRAEADAIFLAIMKEDGVPWYQRWPMYLAVRTFGYLPWRKLRGKSHKTKYEIIAIAIITFAMLASNCLGQSWQSWPASSCTNGSCGPSVIYRPPVQSQTPQQSGKITPHPDMVVRIIAEENHQPQRGMLAESKGTGTVVKLKDGYSYVLTNYHVVHACRRFYCENGKIKKTEGALIAVDIKHDLALIQFPDLGVRVASCDFSDRESYGNLTVSGFGQGHTYRVDSGPHIKSSHWGSSTHPGVRSEYPGAVVRAAVRSGDSGGPVVDVKGNMVGVLWGVDDTVRETYCVVGRPIRNILSRIPIIGKRNSPPVSIRTDIPPTQPQIQPTVPRLPAQNTKPLPSPALQPAECSESERIDKLEAAVDSLRRQSQGVAAKVEGVATKVQQGQQLNEELQGWKQSTNQQIATISSEAASLREKLGKAAVGLAKEAVPTAFERYAIPALVGGLGLGSPLGIAMVLVGMIRRRKTGRGGASEDRFQG